MSYSQQSQGNSNSLSDGVSPQFSYIATTNQQNSTQNIGMHKFSPSTIPRNDLQPNFYQQFVPNQNLQQSLNTNHLVNGGSTLSSRSASPATSTSLNQPMRNIITSNGQPTVSSSSTSLVQDKDSHTPTNVNLSGSMKSLSIGTGSIVPIIAGNIPTNMDDPSPQNLPINNYNANYQININSSAKNQKYLGGNFSQQQHKFESQQRDPQTTNFAISSPIKNNENVIQQQIFQAPPNTIQYNAPNNPITQTSSNNLPPKSNNQQQQEYIINQNGSIIVPGTEYKMSVSEQNFKPLINYNVNNNSNIQQHYQHEILASEQKDITSPSSNTQNQQYSAMSQQLHQAQPAQQFLSFQQQNYQSRFNGQSNNAPLQYQSQTQHISQQRKVGPSVTQQGFNKLWGYDTVDLMQNRQILPRKKLQPPLIRLNHQLHDAVNCSPDIFRCTVTKIPESNSLLQKSRLPLGILIHPFRDLNNLAVIQCATIVRCRLCRTYINPFVYFVDSKKWKCNLCYRINELPEEFQYDPVSKSYGDVTRRPEVKSSTIEFIAPSEYMLRPPQPAIYLFLLDVSILAEQSGYLEVVCNTLLENLPNLPGDARTRVGFIAYNSAIHFYNIAEGFNQPHEITVVEVDDVFLPCPDNLLINLKECKELIKDLLVQMPSRFSNSHDSGSALGAALQVAFKLMSASGGRVTVFQACLPNKGPGALQARENPNNRSSRDVLHLGPATDFYKRQALECSGQQIAVDLFLLNQQYSDLATLSGVCKYSGGCVYHFPLFQKTKANLVDSFKKCLERYLTRKIGFEAVMRVRCTRGLQIHTFHGNFFVRSTDLLSLPNVNPDSGYGMQISYDENLTDVKTICFQAALLYTSSKGERRIRVHTLCLPVTSSLTEVINSADVHCIIGLLSKMAVDRSFTTSVSDARDAFINATVDIISSFKTAQNLPQGQTGQLLVPQNLSLLPLYILALLKHPAFRTGTSTRLDDRVFAMDAMKTLPLDQLIKYIYPEFYLIDCLFYNSSTENEITNRPEPPILQLTAEYIDSRSIFLIDSGLLIIIYVGLNVPVNILQQVFGVQTTAEIPDFCYGLPTYNTPENEVLHMFIDSLNEDKPYSPTIQIIRDTSSGRNLFMENLLDDRSEASLSYYEFLQHLRSQVK